MIGIEAMTSKEYHADPQPMPSLSASVIHAICSQSPLHAWTAHPRLNPLYKPKEDEKLDIGTMAHALVLEGVNAAEVIDAPDWRTKAAKELRDLARRQGKVPVLREKYADVQRMIEALRNSHAAVEFFIPGRPEQVLLWEEDGVYCRARLDWLADDYSAIWDYKTTSGSANPEVVSKTLFDHGYDIQASWYLRGLKKILDHQHTALITATPDGGFVRCEPQFRFIYQETYPPYALSVIALGPDVMMLAEKKILYAIDLWRKCLATNEWPGYPGQTCFATLPKWEEERWLRKETI